MYTRTEVDTKNATWSLVTIFCLGLGILSPLLTYRIYCWFTGIAPFINWSNSDKLNLLYLGGPIAFLFAVTITFKFRYKK